MRFSKLIAIVDKAYPDADVSITKIFETMNNGKDPDWHGDTLAAFIVRELLDTYDQDAPTADQLREAIRVMDAAHADIYRVRDALAAAFNALPSLAELHREREGSSHGDARSDHRPG